MEILIMQNIMSSNQKLADENRLTFSKEKILVINIMASPGAGKTSVITKLLEYFNHNEIGIIEGDIASNIDAEKFEKMGIPVIQINTGGGCHLDANMIKTAFHSLAKTRFSMLFIENVGNLVCPSTFDLGENVKMVIASIPEGHDKPYKYPAMFQSADVILLNKIDLLPYMDFQKDLFIKGVGALNENVEIIEISSKTGQGFDFLVDWIKDRFSKAIILTK